MGIVVKGGPRRGLALSSSPRRHILAKRGLAFSLVRLDKRKPPLNVYRNKKNGSFGQFTRQVSRRANEGKVSPPVTPCNIYVGENFSVRLQRYFYFLKLMEDNSHGGLVHNNFHPHRKLKEMTLSRAAIRLATVPNAGGNSVLSEVISFEFFRSCFNAKLLKVHIILLLLLFCRFYFLIPFFTSFLINIPQICFLIYFLCNKTRCSEFNFAYRNKVRTGNSI